MRRQRIQISALRYFLVFSRQQIYRKALRMEGQRMLQAKILHKQGLRKCEIAKELEVNRRTVYNYLNDKVFDDTKSSRGRPCGSVKLRPYFDFIEQKLEDNLFVNTELVYEKILTMGYAGKTTILGDYIRRRRKQLMDYAVFRFETIPGHQAQVDWAECGYVWENGIRKKRYAFVMKLGYSRRSYMEFTTSMAQPILFACMKRAFAYFGGVAHEILFDNMKTAFLYDATQERWVAHPKMLAFAVHYGFVPKRCRVRRPETKGKVEREIRYLRSSFFAGLAFEGMDMATISTDKLNELVSSWLVRVDGKILRELGESRRERFKKDYKALQALPAITYDHRKEEVVVVSREAQFRFDGNTYSVDGVYRGKTLQAKHDPDANTLTVYHQGIQVKHIVLEQTNAGKKVIDESDRKSLLRVWYEDRERCQRQRHRQTKRKRDRAQQTNTVTDPKIYDAVFGMPQQISCEEVLV